MEDLALQELGRVAELQPDFADVHYELGLLHAKRGRKQDAISALTQARDLDPGDDRASRLLAKLTGAA
jgi:Flp pilus assembly protein TadD